ncbi:hypothetical protein MMC16_004817 [Acarospora aff. strigata]|nr:hypothetical protein [Acarospora aff. strigata]
MSSTAPSPTRKKPAQKGGKRAGSPIEGEAAKKPHVEEDIGDENTNRQCETPEGLYIFRSEDDASDQTLGNEEVKDDRIVEDDKVIESNVGSKVAYSNDSSLMIGSVEVANIEDIEPQGENVEEQREDVEEGGYNVDDEGRDDFDQRPENIEESNERGAVQGEEHDQVLLERQILREINERGIPKPKGAEKDAEDSSTQGPY